MRLPPRPNLAGGHSHGGQPRADRLLRHVRGSPGDGLGRYARRVLDRDAADARGRGASRSLASDVLISTEWDGSNYLQSSVSYFASATCSSQNTWQVSWVGSTWNDRLQSGATRTRSSSTWTSAARSGPPRTARDYGTLANEASSLRWKP